MELGRRFDRAKLPESNKDRFIDTHRSKSREDLLNLLFKHFPERLPGAGVNPSEVAKRLKKNFEDNTDENGELTLNGVKKDLRELLYEINYAIELEEIKRDPNFTSGPVVLAEKDIVEAIERAYPEFTEGDRDRRRKDNRSEAYPSAPSTRLPNLGETEAQRTGVVDSYTFGIYDDDSYGGARSASGRINTAPHTVSDVASSRIRDEVSLQPPNRVKKKKKTWNELSDYDKNLEG